MFLDTGWLLNACQMEMENQSSLAVNTRDMGIQAAMTGVYWERLLLFLFRKSTSMADHC